MVDLPIAPRASSLGRAPFGSDNATRDELFREAPYDMALRWLMGTAYACHPKRISSLPYLLCWTLVDLARGGTDIPDQARTHNPPDTFGGVCHDITPEKIMAAARLGFYPWCHLGPLKWWTRSQRMVLVPSQLHIPKRLAREMRKTDYKVTFDQAFDDVIKACAGHRKGRPTGLTWITPQIMRLYSQLFDQGHAHSFEVWSADGRLIGGGYGIAFGRIFVGESQFSHETNTSKMGFCSLHHHLAKWGYVLSDGKDYTQVIASLGFDKIPRAEYEAILKEHAYSGGKSGPWTVEDDLATIAA